jgi:hypothetical protein
MEEKAAVQLALTGGFGRYYLRERFLDPGLSPTVFSTTASSLGGFGGLEASVRITAFRIVLAYGYHVARAEIADRIRGTVDAGGHEISIGIGVAL